MQMIIQEEEEHLEAWYSLGLCIFKLTVDKQHKNHINQRTSYSQVEQYIKDVRNMIEKHQVTELEFLKSFEQLETIMMQEMHKAVHQDEGANGMVEWAGRRSFSEVSVSNESDADVVREHR